MRAPIDIERDGDTGALDLHRSMKARSIVNAICETRARSATTGPFRWRVHHGDITAGRMANREIAVLIHSRLPEPYRDGIIRQRVHASADVQYAIAGLSRKQANPRLVIDGLTCKSICALSIS